MDPPKIGAKFIQLRSYDFNVLSIITATSSQLTFQTAEHNVKLCRF